MVSSQKLPQYRSSTSSFRAFLGCFLSLFTAASAQTIWTAQNSGAPSSLSGVAFGGGKFVVVGDAGTILTSPDGENWTAQASGTTKNLRGIAFGNGTYIAVGDEGTGLSSPDGVVWTGRSLRTQKFLSGATFGNGRFVAVGGSGTIRYSTDGLSWQLGINNSNTFFQNVTFGDGRYVAVGSSGGIVYSGDGQSWNSATSGTSSYLTGISYSNGTYTAKGQFGTLLSSTDANTWNSQTAGTPAWLRSSASNGSHTVAVGADGTIIDSADGTAWNTQTSGVSADLNAIAYGAGRYVVVGASTGTPQQGVILTSPDDHPVSEGFAAWQQQVFDSFQLDDPSISGSDADPNCDGFSNFYAYGLGLDPFLPADPSALPCGSLESGEDGFQHHVLTFVRPADRVGFVTYALVCSSDLVNWVPIIATEVITSEVGGVQTVTITDPVPASPSKFYQLRLSSGS